MSPSSRPRSTLLGGLDARALAETLAGANVRVTLRPGELEATADASASPPATPMSVLDTLSGRFEPRQVIGRGGMAVVRSAVQRSLGREVALKALLPGATGDQAEVRLLREAWTTGLLEHPNVVPVHDVGVDDGGSPVLVLKRIEGQPWSALIDQPDEIRRRFGSDPLEWNLQQLERVCHAVAFAHDRHVLHRDLKPDNVMIGDFGEVYVLDWGIAVSLVDDGTGRLPLATECKHIAGTLAYMAPEMLGAGPLSERTDVYLLGAILYEIATGKPPHLCASIADTIESITERAPTFPDDVPAELAAICRRALDRDPGGRHPSVESLRLAIRAFVEHRGSSAITRESRATLEELIGHVGRAGEPDRVQAYALFGQCRFGFKAALRQWPENREAREGLDRALSTMASFELDHDDARAAAVLVAELSEPIPALTARLERSRHEAAERARRIARFEADQDTRHGSAARTGFLIVLGLAWSMVPLGAIVLPSIEVSHATSLLVASTSIAAIVGFGIVARAAMMKTLRNRGIWLTVLVAVVLHAVLEAAAWGLGLDMVLTHLMAISLWAGACGIAAVFLDRALLFPTLGFLVALAATVRWPEHRFWTLSASLGVLLGAVLYILLMSKHAGRRIAGLAERLRLSE